MTTAADPAIYPSSRKNRGAGVALDDLAPSPAPRMRVFPFIFVYTNNSRRSVSTPRLVGPGIIKDFTVYRSFAATPPQQTFEIGVAQTLVVEAGVALTTPRPYTVLTELLDPFGYVAGASGDGYPITTLPTGTDHFTIPLDLIVTDAEFFAVVAHINNRVASEEINGYLRVLEAVDREALSGFL
jgi:hypothetical protein